MMEIEKKTIVAFDLDDTLYKEKDYLKSAFREIADKIENKYCIMNIWEQMLQLFYEGKDVFQNIISMYKIPIDKKTLINMYREHIPTIHLDEDTEFVLEFLSRDTNKEIVIITDGRSITQRNKVKALGLCRYIADENMVIVSEEHGHVKPDSFAFKKIETMFPNQDYIYVGDNPQKDFYAPNLLSWKTICLLDDGRNIHLQNFKIDVSYQPQHIISNIKELLQFL